MGRHTTNLSDWDHCGLCNRDLEHGVCMCCGSGTKHICPYCMKTKKKGVEWGWAIGDNKGCDEHLQKGDIKFPMEFNCFHVKCIDCRDPIDGRYCARLTFANEPVCKKCEKNHNKKYFKKKPKVEATEMVVVP